MRFNRFVLVCSLALAGCLGNVDSSTQRIVTGKVVTKDYKLDNAVVVAESSDHRVFVTHLMRDGSFKLQLPQNVAYRLTLANTTRSGSYVSVARVNWPLETGANRWAMLGAGATLDLGHVYHRGSTQWGIQCSGCSGGGYDADKGGDCHEDDSAKCAKSSSENDCDSDHKYKDGDNCDKDDDADKHDQQCDKNDGDDHSGDGGYGGSDDGDDDHHNGGSCDGGAGGAGGAGGSGGAGSGGMCMMNVDCATGLDCVASVCTTPTTSM